MTWDNKNKMKTLDEILIEILDKESKKVIEPKVILSQIVDEKACALCKEYESLEWMAAIIGDIKIEDNTKIFYGKDIVVIEQEVDGSNVHATDKGNKTIAELPNVIGWIHSHNRMDSFQSGTDHDTGYNFELTITTNNKSEYTGVARTKATILDKEYEITMKTDIVVEYEPLHEEFIVEAKKLISPIHIQVTTRYPNAYGVYEDEYTVYGGKKTLQTKISSVDNLCVICDNPVGKRKAVECSICHDVMHKKCYNKQGTKTTDGQVVCPYCMSQVYYEEEFGNPNMEMVH